MANKRLSLRKREEALRLHHACSRSNRDVAPVVGASPATVGDYLRRARLAGIGWPLPADLTESALFPPPPASQVKLPKPDWATVHRQLGRKGSPWTCSGRRTGSPSGRLSVQRLL